MGSDELDDQPDPAEVQPTDNSAGVPVDLERLEEPTTQQPQPTPGEEHLKPVE